MYALVIADTIRSVSGRLPAAARDLATGDWVCPDGGAWTIPQAESCGWFLVVSTPSPAVTAAEVADSSVTLVAGVPQITWTIRPKSPEEVADETASTNERALLDKARAALTSNGNAIAQLETFAAGTVALTNTQRDSALRDLATHQARVFKELNALIKLQVRDLADTTGT